MLPLSARRIGGLVRQVREPASELSTYLYTENCCAVVTPVRKSLPSAPEIAREPARIGGWGRPDGSPGCGAGAACRRRSGSRAISGADGRDLRTAVTTAQQFSV